LKISPKDDKKFGKTNFIKEIVAVDLRLDSFVWVPPVSGIENKNISSNPSF